ncbi:MAG: hypothetical protein DME45_11145, partial [Verrucomicrobia bacterium]
PVSSEHTELQRIKPLNHQSLFRTPASSTWACQNLPVALRHGIGFSDYVARCFQRILGRSEKFVWLHLR